MTTTDSRCSIRSLRDRKREATEQALIEAAFDIVRNGGLPAVTAEAVAERAGVSRRTFFNYFPSVESVLTASVGEFFDRAERRLLACPEDEDVLDCFLGIIDAIEDSGDLVLVQRLGMLAAAGQRSAQARGLLLAEVQSRVEHIEAWLRGRLDESYSDLYVATLAAALPAAGQAAMRVWVTAALTEHESPLPSFRDLYAEAIAHLRHGFSVPTP